MRSNALLALILYAVPSVFSVFVDEAYHVDYHQALLGIPQVETTFFHRPSAASSASLLYTISEKAILGAVNPKDGSLVWRQPLADSLAEPYLAAENMNSSEEEQLKAVSDTGPAKAGLFAGEASGSVISYYGSTVSSWDAMNGKLVWQIIMPREQHIRGALLVPSQHEPESSSAFDIVILYGLQSGTVRRLDGSSGAMMWEHKGANGATPRFIASTEEKLFYASEQSAVLGSNSMKVASLELKDGQETKSHSVKTDNTLCTVSCPNIAFTSWFDKSSKNINLNILGSSKLQTLTPERRSGEEVEGVTIIPSCGSGPSLHFLVHVHTSSGTWAEVFHIAVESGEVSRAYRLPYVEGKDAFAVSSVDDKVYFTRITDLEIELYSSASSDVLTRWPRSQPSRGVPSHAQAEVVLRGESSFAIRVAEASRHGEWTLMRNDELVWSRPEMLADVVAAAWADELPQEALAHDLDMEGHENPLRAYIHRVNRHLRDLEYFPPWLQQLPMSILSGLLSSKSEAEKGLLGSKSLIVVTSKGQYLALDPVNAGAIKWTRLPRHTSQEQQSMSLFVKDRIVTSYVNNLGVISMNVTDGEELSFDQSDARFTKVAIAPGPRAPVAYHILPDGQPESMVVDDVARDGTYLVTQPESRSDVQGWMVGQSNARLWTFSRGAGYRIANVVARPAHDPVSSIGKVLGDRSVLYKYLSPNLALVTSIKADTFTIDLLDSITGTILYSTTHKSVDTKSSIPSVISENWFTYSFFGNEHPTSPAKSHQLVIVELYESSIPNDRGPLQSASNYSSFDPGSITKPHIITQSFIIPQPISHMSVTQTAQGITSRQLLCTLPHLNAIAAIPRHILDPRRPIDRDPTPHEAEEGLFRYSPVLDLDPKSYLSHAREVMGIQKIISAPTLLESTSMVFAFGLDIFGTRVTPSKAFDVLGKGFNKIALILTVVALGLGTTVLAPMVRRKQVERGWKM